MKNYQGQISSLRDKILKGFKRSNFVILTATLIVSGFFIFSYAFAAHTATVEVNQPIVKGGSSHAYTFTIANDPASANLIYDVQITAPDGFSISDALSCPTGWAIMANTPTNVECLGNGNPSSNLNIKPNHQATIAFLATAPGNDSTNPWTVTAVDNGWDSNSYYPVTIVDATAPSITAPADIIDQEANGVLSIVNLGTPVVSDNFDPEPIVNNDAPDSFSLGTTEVTWTATDHMGNSATAIQEVTVVDTTAPEITPPDAQTFEATGSLTTPPDLVLATAEDIADSTPVITYDIHDFAVDSYIVTWTATDASGNFSTAQSQVTIQDTAAPEITSHLDETVEATGADGAIVNYSLPTASDLVDGVVVVSCDPIPGTVFVLGETPISCSATDSHRNTSNSNFIVEVVDTTAPVIDVSVNVINVEATSPLGAPVDYDVPMTHDAVDGDLPAICLPDPGSVFPLGVTIVTCDKTDIHNNVADSTIFTVAVVDTTAPEITPPDAQTFEATGPLTTPSASDLVLATAEDIADQDPIITYAPQIFPVGDTTVIWTATDASKNTAETTSQVTIQDTTAPIIEDHADMVVEATSLAGAVVEYTAPNSHDAVDGDLPANCVPTSDSQFVLGETTVICTKTDVNKNTATPVTFTVIVVDTTAPDITAPDDITQQANGVLSTVDLDIPDVSDLVDGSPDVTNNAPASFPLGTTVVTWTATDAAGNSATAEQNVTIVDTVDPEVGITSPTADQIIRNINGDFSLVFSATDISGVTCFYTIDGESENEIAGCLSSATINVSDGRHVIALIARDPADNQSSDSVNILMDTDNTFTVGATNADFTSIQAAINAAIGGNIIDVAEGIYTEQININKSLTVSGSGRDTTHIVSPDPTGMTLYDAFGSKSPTSRYLTHRGVNIPVVRIVASNVTFEGFNVDLNNQTFWDIKGNYGVSYSKGVGVLIDHVETLPGVADTFTDITIQDNKINGLKVGDKGDGIKALGNSTAIVQNNVIYGYGESSVSVQGVDSPFRAEYYPTVTVKDNTIYGGSSSRPAGHSFFGIGYWSGGSGSAEGNTIYAYPSGDSYSLNCWTPNPCSFVNNEVTIDGSGIGGYGAQLYESSSLTFSDNNIERQSLAAVIWSNPSISVSGNTITNCTDGFIVDQQTSGSVTIQNNSVIGIPAGHYAVKVGGPTDEDSGTSWGTWYGPSIITVDAIENYWGTAVAATVAGKISSLADYDPYYVDEAMEILSDVPVDTVYVDDDYEDGLPNDNHYFGYDAFNKIQDGINVVDEDGTVNVAAGTYTENVNVNKSLTLTGDSSSTVTVNALDKNDYVFDVTANSVNISGFSVSGTLGYTAGIHLGTGVTLSNISNNNITGCGDGILLDIGSNYNTFTSNIASLNRFQGFELHHSDYNTFTDNIANSNTGYGFRLDSAGNNTFTDNIANSNTKNGFSLVLGSGPASNYNMFTNNIANSNTEYGFRMDNGDHNTLTGNTFNLNGVGRLIDAAAIRLKFAVTNLTLNNNNFTNSPVGIDIVSVPDVTSWTLNKNKITGNTIYGVSNNGTGILNAARNWWGTINGTTIASKINGNVNYRPWCIEEACTTNDGFPPMVTVNPLKTKDTTPVITGTVSEGNNININVNGNNYTATVDNGNWQANVTDALSEGTYNVVATAEDLSGNIGTDITNNELIIDITPPTVILTQNHSDLIIRDADTVLITATFYEAMASIPTITINFSGASYTGPMINTSGNIWTYSWNVQSGLDGVTIVTVAGVDLAGNPYAGSDNITFTIDNTAPILNITAPVPGASVNGTTVIVFADNESTNPKCSVNNTNWVSCVNGITTLSDITGFDALSQGSFTLYLKDTDVAGNIGNSNVSLIKDTIAPIAEISGTPTNPTNQTGTAITVGGDGVAYYKYKLNGGSYGQENSISTLISLSGLTDGIHIVSVIGRDQAGNWQNEGSAISYTWTVDTGVPTLSTVTIASDNANTTLAKVGNIINLTFVANENLTAKPTIIIATHAIAAGNVIQGSDARHWTATYTMTVDDAEGTVPFTINFSDIATNPGVQVSATIGGSSVTFDKTDPVVSISAPSAGAKVNGDAVISFTANGISPECSVNNTNWYTCVSGTTKLGNTPGGTGIPEFGNLLDVSFTLSVRDTDAAGNIGTASRSLVKDTSVPIIEEKTPDVNAVGVSPVSDITITFNEAVNITAGNVTLTPSSGILTVTFDLGTKTATINPSVNLNDNSTYTITLSGITDLAGNPLPDGYTWSFTTAASYSIGLKTGWNLISLPVTPTTWSSTTAVLASVSGNMARVWTYNAVNGTWSVYNASGAPSNLNVMTAGHGYWVKMTGDNTLTGVGTLYEQLVPSGDTPSFQLPEIPLAEGWNLIGYYQLPGKVNSPITNALSKLSGAWSGSGSDLITFTKGTLQPTTPISEMQPGVGYWIFMSNARKYSFGNGNF